MGLKPTSLRNKGSVEPTGQGSPIARTREDFRIIRRSLKVHFFKYPIIWHTFAIFHLEPVSIADAKTQSQFVSISTFFFSADSYGACYKLQAPPSCLSSEEGCPALQRSMNASDDQWMPFPTPERELPLTWSMYKWVFAKCWIIMPVYNATGVFERSTMALI
jgi:hypothetical protein